MKVEEIPTEWTHKMILKVHYARKIPSIMYSFGLFHGGSMIGICTFGMPPNIMLIDRNIFNNDISVKVVELNRLCVEDGSPKNSSSFLVSNCLKMLPKPLCVVSYADRNQGHVGYIYQATNWIYTGESSGDRRLLNTLTNTISHRKTIFNEFNTSSIKLLPDHFKSIKEDKGKHRYFYFLGNHKQIKLMKDGFKYPILPYPKGESKRYVTEKQLKRGFFGV